MYFLDNIKKEENQILELNKIIKKDIIITKENAITLINNKNTFLKEIGRIDLTNTIIENIIITFIDSPYIEKDNYLNILISLIETFITYEHIFSKKLSSEEILNYLKDEFAKNEGCIDLLNNDSLEKLCDKLC